MFRSGISMSAETHAPRARAACSGSAVPNHMRGYVQMILLPPGVYLAHRRRLDADAPWPCRRNAGLVDWRDRAARAALDVECAARRQQGEVATKPGRRV